MSNQSDAAKNIQWHEIDRFVRKDVLDSFTFDTDAVNLGEIRKLRQDSHKALMEASDPTVVHFARLFSHNTNPEPAPVDATHLFNSEREYAEQLMDHAFSGADRTPVPSDAAIRKEYSDSGLFENEAAIESAIQMIKDQAASKAQELRLRGEEVRAAMPSRPASFAERIVFDEGAMRAADKGY